MDNHNISRHISGQFNAELEAIRTHVLTMGGLVERQLTDALRAMHNQDVDLARHVIREDHKVNGMEVAIDEACTRIIAKRQPTASDLRLVMAIIKTITDLERIGDVADSIAKMALDNSSHSQQPFLVSLEALGQRAAKMLHEVLDAFARMDIEAAMRVYRKDDSLDREYEGILRQLMTYMMEDPRSIPNVLKVMWSARAIERVGDRCQNICEYIIYFVKGKDVRHIQKEELEKLLK
ncbi:MULTISPECIES: phosphate signaling complex protein PhoU [Salinivibrio]|uniref:Phosphate-specific transport system accessory protein PhoU n=2 Tax=Salinivibrio TaxID=51366 RepID=A0ABY7LAM2_9GAMM|nr:MULTISPECIES: phosphate signaling complex protein PhoU [Salinivibrio]ODP96886.1 phosphate transport system regulatory protein PhoU [Salinivibrio sp. DV]OOF10365.1 phosphate transport system regulatory protein PhoU [Salinivibrio sp. PR5]OOF16607.1 phosphate transport system regulatory protein PhoU [Salinivibrio sp. PR919]OOF17095.1 phosphate transport system regulatory protein PhoU [Salinivibrio sp. PR932]OOF23866.1 phosphate transport system regulatory protein PhoU [Salinivibrio sp. IB574]